MAMMQTPGTEREAIGLLRRLISIPSVNPAYGDDPGVCGEAGMAGFLQGFLADRGFECRLIEHEPGRPNLVAVAGPRHPRKTLLVEGHLDTVSIRGMTVAPFAAEEREGRVYGRGACDMKGAWAAFLAALAPDRLAALERGGIRLTVVGAMGEETGNEGARRLVEEGEISAEEGIVLEPTNLAAVHAHKGIAWFRIRLQGRSGHGSAPERGVNAIEAAAAAIPALRAQLGFADAPPGAWDRPTMSVGRIIGGSGINIVAGECEMDVDCRLARGDNADSVRSRFAGVLSELVAAGRLTGFEIATQKACAPYASSPCSDLLARLSRACAAAGIRPERTGTGWYSDAGPLSEVCGETIVFGPGGIDQAHTPDEWIAVDSVLRAAEIFGVFLEATAQGA